MSQKHPPYRVGFVGAGSISRMHLDGIARHPERMQVVALCDPVSETATQRAAEYSVPETYQDLGTFIRKAQPDVAVVCTPTPVRKQVILPLIEAGIPVFCEKPFAETYAEAVEIERAARLAGVPVAIDQNFRRHFSFRLGREVLQQGHLGRPLHLMHTTAHLRRDRGWRLERHRYVMAVMSIHWFDGYRCLLQDEPEEVYCQYVNSPATQGGNDTSVSVILKFQKGTLVTLSESFSSFTRPNTCCLDCETGGLRFGYQNLIEVRPDGSEIQHDNPFDKVEATYWLLDNLMQTVEQGTELETSAADNVKSIRIMEAAYHSAAEKRVVRMDAEDL